MTCPYCNKFVPDSNYRCPHCRKVLREQGVDPLAFQHEHKQKKSQHITFLLLAAIIIGLTVFVYMMFIAEKEEKAPADNMKTSETKQSAAPQTSKTPQTPQTSQTPQNRDANTAFSAPATGTDTNREQSTSEEIPLEANSDESDKKSDNPYDWVDKEDPVKLARSHIPGEEIDIEKLLLPGQTTIFDFYSEYCNPCKKISPALSKLDNIRKNITVVKININRKGVQQIDWGSPVVHQYNLHSLPYFIIYDSSGYRTHEGEEAYQKVMDLLNEEKIQ